MHKQLHEGDSNSGNAIPLDKIDLLGLHYGKKINCEDQINLSTARSSMLDSEVSLRDCEDDDDCPELQEPIFSELIVDVVEYIAGYVVRSLGRKIRCEECLLAVTMDHDNNPLNLTVNLISIKDRGGLTQPSPDINRLCRICEKNFKMTISKNKIKSNLNHYTNILLSHCANMNFFTESAHLSVGGEHNHKNWLIESIGKIYFSIRMKKYIRDQNQNIEIQRVRQKLKKIIHFKGQ